MAYGEGFEEFDVDEEDDIEGIEEMTIEGPKTLDQFFGNVSRSKNEPQFLTHFAKMRVADHVQLPKTSAATLKKFSQVAKAMRHFQIAQKADYLRKPNRLCGAYGTSQASGGAGVDFTLQPSAGLPAYHFLGFCMSDQIAGAFGMSALTLGGMPMIATGVQSAPVAPIASVVPLVGFQLRESSGRYDLAPWTGQDFDNTTPILFTTQNITSDSDAVTLRFRSLIPIQIDPCGQNVAAAKAHAKIARRNAARAIQHFARL